jgi:uncharacterized protein GlcG (DUF336 family)
MVQTLRSLSLADAKHVAAAASAKAKSANWTVVIALFDAGGRLIYLERADGTQLGSIEVAQAKGLTALMFKRPSKVFEDMVLSGKPNIAALPGASPIEGGLPLFHDGDLVGAIGISGATSAQDGEVARAGADALAIL